MLARNVTYSIFAILSGGLVFKFHLSSYLAMIIFTVTFTCSSVLCKFEVSSFLLDHSRHIMCFLVFNLFSEHIHYLVTKYNSNCQLLMNKYE